MKKVDIDKVMDDCVSIQNQIDGLKMLLANKKTMLSRYFDSSGERQISNNDCVVFVKEVTTVDYNIPRIYERIGKKANDFIEKQFRVVNWDRFTAFCKSKGISPRDLKQFIVVDKKVDEHKLNKLYERGVVELKDLEGCYEASVKKSVVLRLKNDDREIPIVKGSK